MRLKVYAASSGKRMVDIVEESLSQYLKRNEKKQDVIKVDHVYMRMSVAEDAQQLIDLDHRVWNSKNSPAPIHWQSLEQHQNLMPPGYQVVAIIDDKIVGYVSLRICGFLH